MSPWAARFIIVKLLPLHPTMRSLGRCKLIKLCSVLIKFNIEILQISGFSSSVPLISGFSVIKQQQKHMKCERGNYHFKLYHFIWFPVQINFQKAYKCCISFPLQVNNEGQRNTEQFSVLAHPPICIQIVWNHFRRKVEVLRAAFVVNSFYRKSQTDSQQLIGSSSHRSFHKTFIKLQQHSEQSS